MRLVWCLLPATLGVAAITLALATRPAGPGELANRCPRALLPDAAPCIYLARYAAFAELYPRQLGDPARAAELATRLGQADAGAGSAAPLPELLQRFARGSGWTAPAARARAALRRALRLLEEALAAQRAREARALDDLRSTLAATGGALRGVGR